MDTHICEDSPSYLSVQTLKDFHFFPHKFSFHVLSKAGILQLFLSETKVDTRKIINITSTERESGK